MKILYQMKDGLSRGGKLFSLFRGKFQKALDTGSGLWYNILVWRRSSAGQSVRFTSERSRVRAPPSPPRRNGLRSIQKARPFGRAFLIPLRHFSFSPRNLADANFRGGPAACGTWPGRISILPSSAKIDKFRQGLVDFFLFALH